MCSVPCGTEGRWSAAQAFAYTLPAHPCWPLAARDRQVCRRGAPVSRAGVPSVLLHAINRCSVALLQPGNGVVLISLGNKRVRLTSLQCCFFNPMLQCKDKNFLQHMPLIGSGSCGKLEVGLLYCAGKYAYIKASETRTRHVTAGFSNSMDTQDQCAACTACRVVFSFPSPFFGFFPLKNSQVSSMLDLVCSTRERRR